MRVEIYWNLHKGCYSIRALEGLSKGRVIAHANKVLLRDVSFHVSEAGKQQGKARMFAFDPCDMPEAA